MNPSTQELLDAVNALPADGVIILPNNKNIIAVAEQVGAEANKPVKVVHSKSIVDGMASLVAYDPEANLDQNASEMSEVLEDVSCGEVTKSVRDTTADGFEIATGDWLGLAGGKIAAVESDSVAAAVGVVNALVGNDHEIITIVSGEDASNDETLALVGQIELSHPDLEAEVHSGGQPLYPFIIGVE